MHESRQCKQPATISTGYINFAVPHGVGSEVREQSVAVELLPNGVKWGEKLVYCVMLMSVDPETLEDFQNMYNALLLLLMETDLVTQLRKVSDFKGFSKIMLSTNMNSSFTGA